MLLSSDGALSNGVEIQLLKGKSVIHMIELSLQFRRALRITYQ